MLLWASSGQPLMTRSPGSQRVKPGETLGSQGPVRVSREKRKDSLPLARAGHGLLAVHTASSSLPSSSGAPTEHSHCRVVPVVVQTRLPQGREPLPESLRSSPAHPIYTSLVSIHRRHLCLWRLIWETVPRR